MQIISLQLLIRSLKGVVAALEMQLETLKQRVKLEDVKDVNRKST